MIDMPPGKYFISHSYKDAAVRDEMLKQLPGHVEPFIFPPISVAPHEFVSNALIEAILDCDGLIYLNEGESAKSFWVAFERDYALRANISVYSYTPSVQNLSLHNAPAMDLKIFPAFALDDLPIVQSILRFMKHERYFDLADWIAGFTDEQNTPDLKSLVDDYDVYFPAQSDDDNVLLERWLTHMHLIISNRIASNLHNHLPTLIRDVSERGGYVVVFHSKNVPGNNYVGLDIMLGRKTTKRRLIFGMLDDTEVQSVWGPQAEKFDLERLWSRVRRYYLDETDSFDYVQLYGDNERSHTQRIDDLIVRLYWLIFRNQFPDLVYD